MRYHRDYRVRIALRHGPYSPFDRRRGTDVCFTDVALDKKAASIAAHLHAELIHRNKDIGVKDTLIAAICLSYNVPLLTANVKHFSRVDGLTLIDPASWN